MYFFNRIERPLLDLMDMFPDLLLCELYRLGGIPLGLCGFGLLAVLAVVSLAGMLLNFVIVVTVIY